MAKEPLTRKHDITIWYVFAAVFGMLLLQWIWANYSQVATIPFSQFDQLVSQDKVNLLLGPFASNFALADSAIAEKYQVPMA